MGWAGCGEARSVMASAAVTGCQRGRALPQGLGGHEQRGGTRTQAGFGGPLPAGLAIRHPVSSSELGGRAS